jgi:hypothetical protein
MYQDPENEDLKLWFGELGIAAISLFFVMTGGADWGDYYHAVSRCGEVYSVMFLFYVVLTFFAVINIVTGVFVDSAISIGKSSLDIAVADEVSVKKDHMESLRTLFTELHKDENFFELDLDELRASLNNESVIAFFKILKLDVRQADLLFRMLDRDGSGSIDMDEFIHGCYELKGDASLFDQKIMQSEQKVMQSELKSIKDMLSTLLQRGHATHSI